MFGLLVLFACVGRILIQIILWKTYSEDFHLKMLGFLAISILAISIFVTVGVFETYSVCFKNYAVYSFEWIIEVFFLCLFAADVMLAGGVWLLEYLQKKFGIAYGPNK